MSKLTLINPFFIEVEPMQRLLLINFSKDPDEFYVGFEPQVFSLDGNADTYVVIGWRTDGKVDVYYESLSNVKDKNYAHTGKGLSEKVKTDFGEADFQVGPMGVTASFQFLDKYAREITIEIQERNKSERHPFSLLAPMGMAAEKPDSFPLLLLYEFYFVRKKETILKITIDKRNYKPDLLPLPIDGNRMTFSRYSTRPLIAYLNPSLDDHITVIQLKDKQKDYQAEDCMLSIEWQDSVPSIKRMTKLNETYPIALTFSPPFPNIVSLENNQLREGTFTILSHPSIGKVSGQYAVVRKGKEIKVKCSPSEGWLPVSEKWELKVLYKLAPVFSQWPKTYEWTGYITERNSLNYYLHSKWKRVNLK